MRARRVRRLSFCALFLDTKSAYYRVVRELAFGSLEDDRAVVELFQRFQVPPSALEELMKVVHAGGTMAQAGMNEHLRALVQDLHIHSWFVTPYSDGSKVAMSRAGSRPGESWADIVFAFVYCKVLDEIKQEAQSADLVLTLPSAGDCSPLQWRNRMDLLMLLYMRHGRTILCSSLGMDRLLQPWKRQRVSGA